MLASLDWAAIQAMRLNSSAPLHESHHLVTSFELNKSWQLGDDLARRFVLLDAQAQLVAYVAQHLAWMEADAVLRMVDDLPLLQNTPASQREPKGDMLCGQVSVLLLDREENKWTARSWISGLDTTSRQLPAQVKDWLGSLKRKLGGAMTSAGSG